MICRVVDFDVVDLYATGAQTLERRVERLPHLVVEQIAEVRTGTASRRPVSGIGAGIAAAASPSSAW